jgi:hypothetical protein
MDFRGHGRRANKETQAMPDQETLERAERDKREGKSPGTQAGEFVREEMDHIGEGRHGARSTKQAIAIGLSKARRAGVKLPPPKKGAASAKTRKSATRASAAGRGSVARKKRPSAKRSRAATKALRREGHGAASKSALSKHAKSAARKRSAASRSASARKAARTKGADKRSAAARKAARTRARRGR